MNPPLEASWRHPWRQDLHTGEIQLAQGMFERCPLVLQQPHPYSRNPLCMLVGNTA
ncbi:hypothetical protein [Halorhodospira halochloris]|uniref:hypothetical protein n=1 Tax=Halorhodospira halochloris TaxID=1052 RepID=UPI0013A564BC|nr:hypothetical protein [Halorhodospira halochloris]